MGIRISDWGFTADHASELTDGDLERLAIDVERLKVLVNDPDALMIRAQALRDGTAERLI